MLRAYSAKLDGGARQNRSSRSSHRIMDVLGFCAVGLLVCIFPVKSENLCDGPAVYGGAEYPDYDYNGKRNRK